MDDSIKIRALMTYYEHWGNKQNEIRRAIDGATKFRKLFHDHRFLFSMACRSYLRRHHRRFSYDLIDILLRECGGGFRPNELLPDHWDRTAMLMIRRLQSVDRFHISHNFYNAIDSRFTPEDALSVDAIIAFF